MLVTGSVKYGMVLDTVDSLLDGIMTSINVICLCQDMSSTLSNASNIWSCHVQNIPHIIGTYPNMEPRFNMMCLEEFGHPQPPTPLKTDNTTAEGIANDTVKQKHSKAMDMRYNWM
jgi:hypothetical protein